MRTRLPNRRPSITFDFEVAGLRYTATASRFADGRLGEIFLSNHRTNSAADVAARDSAIACSLALQWGADLETVRRALSRDAHGRPSGPLGAALDLIAEDDHRVSLPWVVHDIRRSVATGLAKLVQRTSLNAF